MPAELQALETGSGAATGGVGNDRAVASSSSSLYEACAWFSTGLGDHHSHDAQIGFIPCGFTAELWHWPNLDHGAVFR